MKTASWFIASLSGAAVSAGLILACSDDSPGDADAAVCDCPAAEAPLAGRIVKVTNTSDAVPNGGTGTEGVVCPTGATLLGGGCKQDGGIDDPQLLLFNAGTNSDGSGYRCGWRNDNTVVRTVVIEAICLTPAS